MLQNKDFRWPVIFFRLTKFKFCPYMLLHYAFQKKFENESVLMTGLTNVHINLVKVAEQYFGYILF